MLPSVLAERLMVVVLEWDRSDVLVDMSLHLLGVRHRPQLESLELCRNGRIGRSPCRNIRLVHLDIFQRLGITDVGKTVLIQLIFIERRDQGQHQGIRVDRGDPEKP